MIFIEIKNDILYCKDLCIKNYVSGLVFKFKLIEKTVILLYKSKYHNPFINVIKFKKNYYTN